MSLEVGVPLLAYCLVCTRWGYKRCIYTGADDSKSWKLAESHELEAIPRMCQLVLAVYEDDLEHPKWAPPGGYKIAADKLIRRNPDKEELIPPYVIYSDDEHQEIVLAIRGLNLARENDYLVLWDNKLGKQKFDDGYVHHGLLKAAVWLLNKERTTLAELRSKHPAYTLVFAGHSLGSGIAALMAVLGTKFPFLLGNPPRTQIRCLAFAPSRCISLNLAVKYADVIYSVILQDDFLPRTATPLEDIFKSIFCLPCLLGYRCLRDTCISEKMLLRDPRRLYVPGRIYHIVERKFCSCVKYPPEVRSGIPVEGRFEHIVLSCNATQDHSIVAIMRESEKALKMMSETETEMQAPVQQKMTRLRTRKEEQNEEHKAALRRAATLDVPGHDGSLDDGDVENNEAQVENGETNDVAAEASSTTTPATNGDAPDTEGATPLMSQAQAEAGELKLKMNWDELLESLFPSKWPLG